MTPPGTFERVYQTIKRRLSEGFYKPGTRLEPAILSDELNASVTPVREALHRLTGERLVETPKLDGFRTPMMTETLLRQLYGWHLDLLLLAVMKHHASAPDDDLLPDAISETLAHERLDALFLELAREAGNPEHVIALRSVIERLEPVQRLEKAFLDGTEVETNEIVIALRARDRKLLRNSLVNYHRRRERIVPELLVGILQDD